MGTYSCIYFSTCFLVSVLRLLAERDLLAAPEEFSWQTWKTC